LPSGGARAQRPYPDSEAELVADAAEQRPGVDAELVEQVAVLVGVDLVGQLVVGAVGLVVLAA